MIGGLAWGAGMRGCETADYPSEASTCEGQKLGGAKAPGSTTLGRDRIALKHL